MRLSNLQKLLKNNQGSPISEKLADIISMIKTNEDHVLTPDEIYQLVSLMDLFQDYDRPYVWKPFLIEELQKLIVQEIVGDDYMEQLSMIRILEIDRSRKHIFVEDDFTCLLGMGKMARYYCLGLIIEDIPYDDWKTRWQSIMITHENYIPQLVYGLEKLSKEKNLSFENIDLLLANPAYANQLAEGLNTLFEKNINDLESKSYVVMNAPDANFLAWGYEMLAEKNLLTSYRKMLLSQHARYAMGLADLICEFNKNDIKMQLECTNLLNKAEYLSHIASILFWVGKHHPKEFLQKNVNLFLDSAEYSLGIVTWLIHMDRQSISNQNNLFNLYKYGYILAQKEIIYAMNVFMTSATVRSGYEDWIVKINQKSFDHVIALCQQSHDLEVTVKQIKDYFGELVSSKRDKYPVEVCVAKNWALMFPERSTDVNTNKAVRENGFRPK